MLIISIHAAEVVFVVLTTVMLQLPVMQHSQCNTSLFLLLQAEKVLLQRTQHLDTLWSKYIFPHVQFFAAHLVDGEHVEICDVVLLGVLDPRPALLLVYQLSDVLVHKFALFEKRHVRPATTSDDPRVFVLAKVPLK